MGDEFFQALANPCRRKIIKLLRWKNMSVGYIKESKNCDF